MEEIGQNDNSNEIQNNGGQTETPVAVSASKRKRLNEMLRTNKRLLLIVLGMLLVLSLVGVSSWVLIQRANHKEEIVYDPRDKNKDGVVAADELSKEERAKMEEEQHKYGHVDSIINSYDKDTDQLVITSNDERKMMYMFEVTPKTVIRSSYLDGEIVTTSELKVGMRATVTYEPTAATVKEITLDDYPEDK